MQAQHPRCKNRRGRTDERGRSLGSRLDDKARESSRRRARPEHAPGDVSALGQPPGAGHRGVRALGHLSRAQRPRSWWALPARPPARRRRRTRRRGAHRGTNAAGRNREPPRPAAPAARRGVGVPATESNTRPGAPPARIVQSRPRGAPPRHPVSRGRAFDLTARRHRPPAHRDPRRRRARRAGTHPRATQTDRSVRSAPKARPPSESAPASSRWPASKSAAPS